MRTDPRTSPGRPGFSLAQRRVRGVHAEIEVEGGFPLLGRFLGLSPWAFPDPSTLRSAAELDALRARCSSSAAAGAAPRALTLEQRRRILYDCAKTLLPGGPNAGAYRESVVAADVELPVDRGSTPAACPGASCPRRRLPALRPGAPGL